MNSVQYIVTYLNLKKVAYALGYFISIQCKNCLFN